MSTVDSSERATPPAAPARAGPIAYFAANPVAANLLMLILILGGVVSALQLPIENFPSFSPRFVTVTVEAPGSSAKEVEEDITRRIEEAVVGLAGVERVVGTATDNRGQLRIEMATFANSETVVNDVQNAVDGIENFPPATAERPEVEIRWLTPAVLTLAVSSSSATEHELRLAAETVRDDLLSLPSVSQAELRGTRDREIAIELDEEELRRNDLTIFEVSNAIQRASLNLTFGELRTDAGGVVLHTIAKRQSGDEFADIPLITRLDGTIVTVGDVATIRDGFVDEDIVSEIDGVPAVLVRVNAVDGRSSIDIANNIKAWLETYTAPPDIDIRIWSDRTRLISQRFSEVLSNGTIGILLVLVFLILVFDLRVAFWIALGIPLSFIGALIFFIPAGMT